MEGCGLKICMSYSFNIIIVFVSFENVTFVIVAMLKKLVFMIS